MAIFPDNVEFASLAGTCHRLRSSYKAQIRREMIRLCRRLVECLHLEEACQEGRTE